MLCSFHTLAPLHILLCGKKKKENCDYTMWVTFVFDNYVIAYLWRDYSFPGRHNLNFKQDPKCAK